MQGNMNTRLIVKVQVRGREAGQDYPGGVAEGGVVQGPRQTVVVEPGTQEREDVETTVYERRKEQEVLAEGEGEEDGRPRESVSVERGRRTKR